MSDTLLIRNNSYEKVRLKVFGDEDGTSTQYYTEANGNRYYYNIVSSTQSATMQSATFESFLSFTMSGTQSFQFSLIPMLPEETVMIETKVVGLNLDGSKGYIMKSFGGFKHDGTNLDIVGPSIDYDTKSDFTSASASFTQSGTSSVCLCLSGEVDETIDWDIHINYTKGFHTLTTGAPPSPPPIYPPFPSEPISNTTPPEA